jgi:hypothetical protein
MKKIISIVALLSLAIIFPLQALGQTSNTNNQNTNTEETLNANALGTETINGNVNTAINLSDAAKTKIEQEAEKIVSDPGTLPGDSFYFIKTWFENIQLFFTFNNEHKAEIEYRFALRRASEAAKLAEQGKVELAKKQLEKFEARLKKVSTRLETAKENGKDVDELVAKLELLQQRQQDVLSGVYAQVPDEAKEAILHAMEQSSEGLKNAIENVQGKDKAEEFQVRFEERLRSSGDKVKNEIRSRLESDDESNVNEDSENDETENSNANENTNENENQNRNENENENENQNSNQNRNHNGDASENNENREGVNVENSGTNQIDVDQSNSENKESDIELE